MPITLSRRPQPVVQTPPALGSQTLLIGDVRAKLRTLPAEYFHTVTTSPPYYGLRVYHGEQKVTWASGWHGALGNEPTSTAYITNMVECCRDVYRVLRDDGVFWLNIGDSYSGSGKGAWNKADAQKEVYIPGVTAPKTIVSRDVPDKNLLLIPHRLALALQQDGWVVRACLPWLRRNSMPDSTQDRPTCSIEYVFQLVKRQRYYYDAEAVKQSASTAEQRAFRSYDLLMESVDTPHGLVSGEEGQPLVLDVTSRGFKGAHFACFPLNLIRPLIKASTSEAGCCQVCGAPLRRVVDRQRIPTRPARDTKMHDDTADTSANRDPERHITRTVTTGWEPTCKCAAATVPCRVLDPWVGSGTTLQVCEEVGLHGTGIDICADYASLVEQRIATIKR